MNETRDNSTSFHGIIPPLVTPLSDRDTLDEAGLERLVEHVIAGGAHGIFILGTTGEAPSLSYRLRCELIGRACELVGQRVPVLAGISDTSFVESLHLAEIAADAGASAAVLTAPYYFPTSQAELTRYVEKLCGELPLPLMLYNMPSMTNVWFDFETLRRLTSLERVVGIKDSSGDLQYFDELISLRELRPDWSILMGPEQLLARSLELGGDGGVSGGANVVPRLFVDCYTAASQRDEDRKLELARAIDKFQQIYEVGQSAARHIQSTKCALSLLGICDDRLAEPFTAYGHSQREQVAQVLRSLSLDRWSDRTLVQPT